ncbi:tandem-95 repeat protein [Anaerolineales bacterium HSG24]|nr:tandem-95 repeat protein [Anaerolineales bacterium HSG24]
MTADPGLGALGNNGGSTDTMAIGAGSPAYNAGDNTYCPATDQAGNSRPLNGTCDIGAYEYLYVVAPTPSIPPTMTDIDDQSMNANTTLRASFRANDSDSSHYYLPSGNHSATSSNQTLLTDSNIAITFDTADYSYSQGGVRVHLDITPVQYQSGETTITVQICDTGTGCAQQTFNLTVNPGSRLQVTPNTVDLSADITGTAPVTALLTVQNIWSQTLTWDVTENISWLTASPTSGTEDGQVNLTIQPPTTAGSYSGTMTIDSNGGDFPGGVQTVTVTLSVVNPPQFTSTPSDTSVLEDQLYSYEMTILDGDQYDSLSLDAISKPDWLTLRNFSFAFYSGGTRLKATLEGTPVQANVGVHQISLKATDATGFVDTQSFSLTVVNVNVAPTFTSQPFERTIVEQTYNYKITTEDLDGDTVTISAEQKPTWLVVADNGDGTALLTGTPTQTGSYTVSLKVADPSGTSDTQDFSLEVVETNEPPKFSSTGSTDAHENQTYSYNITVADPDENDTLSISAALKPSWLTFIDNENGTASLEGAPTTDQIGKHYVVSLKVVDSVGQEDSQTFTVLVENTNDEPVLDSEPVTQATQDQAYLYNLKASDVDTEVDPAEKLSFSIANKPAWLTLTDHGDGTAKLSGTPANADVGSYTITVTIKDVAQASAEQDFVLVVANINDLPTFSSIPLLEATEDTTYTYVVSITDPDVAVTDEQFSFANDLPAWLSLYEPRNGAATLEGVPTNDDVGSHKVTLKVTDSDGASDSQTFDIKVANTNDAPEITSNPQTIANQNVTYSYQVTLDDVDKGDQLTLTVLEKPAWLSWTPGTQERQSGTNSTGTLSGVPDITQFGVHNVKIQGQDKAGIMVEQVFTITVVNITPIAVNDELITDKNVPATIDVLANDSDVDQNPLSLVSASGEAKIENGQVLYTPATDFVGTTSFSYTISDSLEQVVGLVDVTVLPSNQAPVAVNDAIETFEGYPATVNLLQNDSDPDEHAIQITSVDVPANGNAILMSDNQQVTYRPKDGFSGTDSFEYQIQESDLEFRPKTDTAQVSVRVFGFDEIQADLELTREESTNSIVVGESQSIVSRFKITNLSDKMAGGVTFKNQFNTKILSANAQANGKSCRVQTNGFSCDLGIIPANGTVEIVATASLIADSPDQDVEDKATVTSLSTDPNGGNNESINNIAVNFPEGRYSYELSDQVTITADKFEELDNGRTRASGNILLGSYFDWFGDSAWLEIEGKSIASGQGQLRFKAQAYPIYTGDLTVDGTGKGQPAQAGGRQAPEINMSQIASFPATNITISQFDLITGKITGKGDVNLPKKGDISVSPITIAFTMDYNMQVSGKTNSFKVSYGSGNKLWLENVTGGLVQDKDRTFLSSRGTLQLNLPGNNKSYPDFKFSVEPSGKISSGSRQCIGKTCSNQGSFDVELNIGGAILSLSKPVLNNYHLSSQTNYMQYDNRTVQASTYINSEGLFNLLGTKIVFGSKTYKIEMNSAGNSYQLKPFAIDYKPNLPQNTQTIKNFNGQPNAANNKDITLKVANTTLILQNPYLKDGNLVGRSAKWIFPKKMGGFSCTSKEEFTITKGKDMAGPCVPDLTLFDFYKIPYAGVSSINIQDKKTFYSLEIQTNMSLKDMGFTDLVGNSVVSLRKTEVLFKTDNNNVIRGVVNGLDFTLIGLDAIISEAHWEEDVIKAAELGLYFNPKNIGISDSLLQGGGASVYNFQFQKGKVSIGGGKFKLPEFKLGGKKGVSFMRLMGELKPVRPGLYDINADGKFSLPGLKKGGGGCGLTIAFSLSWDEQRKRHVIVFDDFNSDVGNDIIQLPPEVRNRPVVLEGISQPILVGYQDMSELSGPNARGVGFKDASVGLDGCNFTIIPEIFFLTTVKGSVQVDPVKIAAEIGMSVGRSLPLVGYPVKGQIKAAIEVPYINPVTKKELGWKFNMTGETKLFDIMTVSKGSLDVDPKGVDMSMRQNFPLGFVGTPLKEIDTKLAAWSDRKGFNMTGKGTLLVEFGIASLAEHVKPKLLGDVISKISLGSIEPSIELGKFRYDRYKTTWGSKGRLVVKINPFGKRMIPENMVTGGKEARWGWFHDTVNTVKRSPRIVERQAKRYTRPVRRYATKEVRKTVRTVKRVTKVVKKETEKGFNTVKKAAVSVLPGPFKLDAVFFAGVNPFKFTFGGDTDNYQLLTRKRVREAWLAKQAKARSGDRGPAEQFLDVDPELTFLPGSRTSPDGRQTQELLVDVNIPHSTSTEITLITEQGNPAIELIGPDGTVYDPDNLPDGMSYMGVFDNVMPDGLSPAASKGLGQLRISHAVDGAPIDVLVNDALVFSQLSYTNTTLYKSFDPGTYQIKFVSGGTTVAETSVELDAGVDYTVMATGEPSNIVAWPVADNNAPRDTSIRLLNAGQGLPAVDLKIRLGEQIIKQVAYQRASDYFEIDADSDYTLDVLDSETGDVLVSLNNVTLKANNIYSLFIYNSARGAQAVLHLDATGVVMLNIVHSAKNQTGLSVSVDGQVVTSTLLSGTTTGNLFVEPGSHTIEILTGTTSLVKQTVELTTARYYTFDIYEEGDKVSGLLIPSQPIIPNFFDSALRFVNLNPNASAVDVTFSNEDLGNDMPLVSNLAYQQASDSASIEASAIYDYNDEIYMEPFTITVYEAGTKNVLAVNENVYLFEATSASLALLEDNTILSWIDMFFQWEIMEYYYMEEVPQTGNWQVKLDGDLFGEDDYILNIDGTKPVPAFSDVHVQNGDEPTIDWKLSSGEKTTSVSVYYKTSPIEVNGVLSYTGQTIASPLTSLDSTWIDGTTSQSYAIPTNSLASGTYYVYLEADDMANEFIKMAAPEPLVIEHIWPDTWQAGLVLSSTNYRQVTTSWNQFPNPDAGEYHLLWQSSVMTSPSNHIISNYFYVSDYGNIIDSLNPGQTYSFTVQAVDTENDRVSNSETIQMTIPGAGFEIATSGALPLLKAGQSTTISLRLTTKLDPYPGGSVGFYNGDSTPGLEMSFTPDMVVPTITGTDISVKILANEFLPSGPVTATIEAKGGGETRLLLLQPTVEAPNFTLASSGNDLILQEDGTITMSVVANRLNGHDWTINLDMPITTPVMIWSFDDDELTGSETAVLTLTDTPMTESGVYTLEIQGDDGINQVTINRTLTVRKPDFIISSSLVITVTPGQATTLQVPLEMLFQDGWSNPVDVMVDTDTELPYGQFGFQNNNTARQTDPDTLTNLVTFNQAGEVELLVETTTDTPDGVYLIPMIAASGERQKSIDLELVVAESEITAGTPSTIYLPVLLKE